MSDINVNPNPQQNPEANQGGPPPIPVPQPPQVPQPALVFVDDPFKGNINPGTSDGAKLHMRATTKVSQDDKFVININNAQKFLMVTSCKQLIRHRIWPTGMFSFEGSGAG